MLIKVLDGKKSTYKYRNELRKLGFRYSSEPKPHWWVEISEEALCEIEVWCFTRKLSVVTPYSERALDYRQRFFERVRGNFGNARYLCVYCGRVLRKDKVSVDHLISVKKSQSSQFYLNLLRKKGFENVNDIRNLAPSCKHCNSRKGTKGGLWLLRGLLGRHLSFWILVWVVRSVLLFCLVYVILSHI